MRYFLILILVAGISSCNLAEDKTPSPKMKFDELENVFSTANWKRTGGGDTSFLYFSRLGDLNYTVYDYTLSKGDSIINEISTIVPQNKGIFWNRAHDTLRLAEADSTMSKWEDVQDPSLAYIFKKISADSLSAESGGKLSGMKQTLPLATFLVRSHYDFNNGTHTVDSPIVKHKGRDLQLRE